MSSAGRRRAGFTLLEVMAAVLILGLLYTVLAEAAIRGLRSEGISRRKVEASLVADRFLADLEAQLALGEMPPTGTEEQEVDIYRVGLSVQAFDPTPILEAIAAVEKERGLDRKPGSSSGRANSMELGGEPAAAPAEDLLAAPRTGEDGRLRRIDVTVAWQDGEREEQVTRTTFAFDTTGLETLFPEKGAAGEGGDAEGGDETAGGDDDGSTPSLGGGGRNSRRKDGPNRGPNDRPTRPNTGGVPPAPERP